MTFNIRLDTPLDAPGGNRWGDRRESVVETVLSARAELLGIQEALPLQRSDLVEALPSYAWVGSGREAGGHGEAVPIFFDRRRFSLEAHGDFWLSEDPGRPGSIGWDARDPRVCTWAALSDRRTGCRFTVFNAHLDVWGEQAKVEGARLVARRMASHRPRPCLLIGDLNAGEDSDVLALLKEAGLRDTFREARPDDRNVGTVHHYTGVPWEQKIDFILCDDTWTVLDSAIVAEKAAGRFPSDHFPVVATLLNGA
jgi:endonuclease/exonuclease/phosphatase family metal-dependent hydrolase